MNKEQFIIELSKLRTSSTFLSLSHYRNDYNEVADYNIVFNISYLNALQRSIMILETLVPEDDYQAIAKKELIDSHLKSLDRISKVSVEDIDDAYMRFFDVDGSYIKGVKLHITTNTLHLYGLVNSKRVITPGVYPKCNKRTLTITKDKLKKLTPLSKFRQFIIANDRLDYISVQGLHLLPPND